MTHDPKKHYPLFDRDRSLSYQRWRPEFALAMDPRFFTVLQVDALLTQHQAGFWYSENAAVVAQVRDYPGGERVIHGMVAAGKLEEIVGQLIPTVEEWAAGIGCTSAVIESREGWARSLKPSGYGPHQVAVIKDIRHLGAGEGVLDEAA